MTELEDLRKEVAEEKEKQELLSLKKELSDLKKPKEVKKSSTAQGIKNFFSRQGDEDEVMARLKKM